MGKAFDSIAAGLNEALAYARGEETGAVVHVIEVPVIPDQHHVARNDRILAQLS